MALHAYVPDSYQGVGKFPETERVNVRRLRLLHPELAHWPDFAFWSVWSDFSQDIYMVGWQESDERITRFLHYLIYLQNEPEWHGGLPEELDSIPLLEAT